MSEPYRFIGAITSALQPVESKADCTRLCCTALNRMRDHDANEERRYLREGRVNVTWSWIWLAWNLGIGVAGPDGDESGSAWINLGPLTVEVYLRKAAS